MNCKFQSREGTTGAFNCALNLYNGKPFYGDCRKCMQLNQNNEEYAKTAPVSEKIKSVVKSTTEWAFSGFSTLTDAQLESRLAI